MECLSKCVLKATLFMLSSRIMRMNYSGEEWHSKGVDLHHALLGSVGGGIAYIGVLCRPDFGFGLTGGIKGNFESLDSSVVWDMKSFMHEVSSLNNTFAFK